MEWSSTTTITIELSAEAEQRLREKAARQGENAETVAAEVLAQALEWEAQDRTEAIEGIQRGLDDFAAARCRPFKEFAKEQRQKYDLSNEA